MAREQVALARPVDLESPRSEFVWILLLAFPSALPFVSALTDVAMGTTTSIVAQMANVKSRFADMLMLLSRRDWIKLIFKVRFSQTNVTAGIEPVFGFWRRPMVQPVLLKAAEDVPLYLFTTFFLASLSWYPDTSGRPARGGRARCSYATVMMGSNSAGALSVR
jgi:hypothetical protein